MDNSKAATKKKRVQRHTIKNGSHIPYTSNFYEKKPTKKATTEFTSSLHACVQPILALFDLKINSELDNFLSKSKIAKAISKLSEEC